MDKLSPEERLLLLDSFDKEAELEGMDDPEFLDYSSSPQIIEESKKHKGRSIGFGQLDKVIDGVCSGELIVVTAESGVGKCFGKGTEVLMFDGSVKKVEEIEDGDFVMGWDSTPRKVQGTVKGQEEMFEVAPVKGEPFICNSSHILTLKKGGDVIDVSLSEYFKWGKTKKIKHKLFHVPVSFASHPVVEPYLLGVWLGDGTPESAQISLGKKKQVIKDELKVIAKRQEWNYVQHEYKKSCSTISLNGGFKKFLLDRDLVSNKHIPHNYKTASEKDRLELLAGLLDTDGHLCNGRNTYEIATKYPQMAEEISFVARSLGFMVTSTKKKAMGNWYDRIFISGDTNRIPLRVAHKQAKPRKQIKNHLITGVKEVRSLGKGDYYGFTIEGDGRFLLADFKVVHNSTLCQSITMNLAKEGRASLWYTLEISLENFLVPFIQNDPEAKWDDSGSLMKVSDYPIYFPKNVEQINFNKLKQAIRYANLKHGVEHVFIDHMHYLLSGKELTSTRNTSLFIGDKLRQLRKIAHETGVSIFLVAHLSKVPSDREPTMNDLRDSSFLQQEADVVLLLHRKRLKTPREVKLGDMTYLETFSPIVHCQIEKSRRTGRKGKVSLAWRNGLYYEITPEEAKEIEKGDDLVDAPKPLVSKY